MADIPDEDQVSRFLEKPENFDDDGGLVWDQIFPVTRGMKESLVWRRHAPTPAEVHAHGRNWQNSAEVRRVMSYAGFTTAVVGKVRAIRSLNGHSLLIQHDPSDGQGEHHAHISIQLAANKQFLGPDQGMLLFGLRRAFTGFTPYADRGDPIEPAA